MVAERLESWRRKSFSVACAMLARRMAISSMARVTNDRRILVSL
jgi:hypothetical protein